MKARKTIRAIVGIALCVAGAWLVFAKPYHRRTFLIEAGGCRLITDIVEPSAGEARGSVVLLHGLAASKKIMAYTAAGFAERGLRVFVPDLPGHGRTSGPFSPERAEACSEFLLNELIARGLIDPNLTIVAGHSMGGAIAERIANRVHLAGVIAISPAPMKTAHGVSPEMLLFKDAAPLPPNSLVVSGAWELESMRGNAADLAASRQDGSAKYVLIPRATHVSLLFDPSAVRASQEWAAHLFHLDSPAALPSRRQLLGAYAGFLGLFLLAGPFLRETVKSKKSEEPSVAQVAAQPSSKGWIFLEFILLAFGTIGILYFWNPLRALRLFQGDYLVSFLLILGIAELLLHSKSLKNLLGPATSASQRFAARLAPLFAAALAAFVLHILVVAWSDLSFNEAWPTASRWARFPILLAALLPYHLAEEFFLGPTLATSGARRLLSGLILRLALWGTLVAGIYGLHSGETLLVLVAPYFALFCLLQRWGMNIVRKDTGSPAAAALFGAILLSGFCLVIFPIT